MTDDKKQEPIKPYRPTEPRQPINEEKAQNKGGRTADWMQQERPDKKK